MKDDFQNQIERLAWEFMVESEGPAEDDNIFLEETELNQEENLSEGASSKQQDDGLYNIYSNDNPSFFNTPNDLNRDSGIIFDEDKLENTRVTDWSKAPPLRQSRIKKILLKLGKLIIAPFLLLKEIFSSFFVGSFWLAKSMYKMFYNIIKALVIFPWQLLVAFKEAFIYLFGDFSWLKSHRQQTVAVRALTFSRPKAIGGFILVAFLLVLPFGIYDLYQASQSFEGRVKGAAMTGVEHLKQAGTDSQQMNFSSANYEFSLAEEEFSAAENSFRELGTITAKAATLIPEVKTGQQLILIAKSSAEIGQHLSQVANLFANLKMDEPNTDLNTINTELDLAFSKANAIYPVLANINLSNIGLGEYQPQFEQIKSELPELLTYLEKSKDIFSIITHLLGADEPKRWMFVFANNSEIRPVLGFMGSYAIIDVEDGAIKNIEVPGGGFYDLKGSLTAKVESWYPFSVFSEYGQTWNSNYFPDYPASAETIEWFYDKSGGSTVDGIIAFSPVVLEKLLELTGEINMPDYDTNINSANFVRMAQIEVELEYDKQENRPKQFIADMLPQVLERTFALKDEKLLNIMQIISNSLAEKHLLIYFNNPDIQQKISNYDWAGEIRQTDKDYLAINYTNVAGGKTDRVIDTVIDHQAEILDDGFILDTVTIIKTHNGNPEDVFEGHTNTSYTRVYVPEGSKLLTAEGFDQQPIDREIKIASIDDAIEPDPHLAKYEQDLIIDPETNMRITREFGKTCFANWVIVAPGETKTVKLTYLLPFQLKHAPKSEPANHNIFTLLNQYFFGKQEIPITNNQEYIYSLLIQKQPGTEEHQFNSHITLAPSWQIKDYLPKSGDINSTNQDLEYNTTLITDRYYGIALIQK